MAKKKKWKPHLLSNEEKLITLFAKAIGYAKGIPLQTVSQYLFGGDTPYLRAKARQVVGRVKWYWLAMGFVLGPVNGLNGWRYCLVAAKEEAARVQLLYARNAAGNLKRALKNAPVLDEAGLLPESVRETLLRFDPFVDVRKLLEGGKGNANQN